ncbi:hypothetical protein CBL_03074 [Carabus blaptoides fortunei]
MQLVNLVRSEISHGEQWRYVVPVSRRCSKSCLVRPWGTTVLSGTTSRLESPITDNQRCMIVTTSWCFCMTFELMLLCTPTHHHPFSRPLYGTYKWLLHSFKHVGTGAFNGEAFGKGVIKIRPAWCMEA